MNKYTIKKQDCSSIDWNNIEPLFVETYPWYEEGKRQNTEVKIVADSNNLFLKIVAEDKYSFAKQTELNNMLVCADSCVEFFFSPSGELGDNYINLEVNCCGTLHLAYGPDRHTRRFISLINASLIERTSSIKSPVKFESEDDTSWTVEIKVPFEAIEKFTGEKVNPNKWFANFYRCGGRQDPQYAVWNDIKVREPDYHRPESFGELIFE